MSLESSWNLEERLKKIKCSDKLKELILEYIDLRHDECTGKKYSILNLYYRSNLHYIEDNIDDEEKLYDELKKVIDSYKFI